MALAHDQLAPRLARLRVPPPHCAMLPALALIVACSAGVPTGVDTSLNPADAPVVVNPRSLILEANQVSVFKAYAHGVPGDSLVTSIEWTATGGSISLNGTYSSPSTGDFKVVGKRHGPTRTTSDTATVTVVPPQPSITSVVISPDPATVTEQTQQTFSAVGKLSDGSTVAIGVTWTATGGTIDAGGVYTAGTTAGTYQVVAKAASANVADTVAVTVTSPPPSGTYPNLPAGMTPIYEYNGSALAPVVDAYVTTAMTVGMQNHYLGAPGSLSILNVTDNVVNMQSPPFAMRHTFPQGLPEGIDNAAIALWKQGGATPDYTEFYMAFRIRMYGNGTVYAQDPTLQKLFYLGYAESSQRKNQSAIGIDGGGGLVKSLPVTYRISEMNDNGTDPGGGATNHPANVPGRPAGSEFLGVGPNHWALVELYVKMNSIPSDPAPRDGTFKIWINGVLTHWYGPGGPGPGLRFRSHLNPLGVFFTQWDPIWGGNTGLVMPQTQSVDLDHVFAAGR